MAHDSVPGFSASFVSYVMVASFFPGINVSHSWIQTLGAAVPFWAPPGDFAPQISELLRLPVPGFSSCLHAHAWWHRSRESHPTVVLVHGVGGSAEAAYVVRAGVAFYEQGYHVVRLDLRGAGTSHREWDTRYHAGLSSDVVAVCTELSRDPRVGDLALIGFSLGGHLALHVAADSVDRPVGNLKAVIALAAPLELAQTEKFLSRPAALPFHAFVVISLVAQTLALMAQRPDVVPCTRRELLAVRSLWGYDDLVVARMHGFLGARDYYERASVAPRLGALGRPTLYLFAADDPMVPAVAARKVLARGVSSALHAEETRQGGHLGWFTSVDRHNLVSTWASYRMHQFLLANMGAP